MNNLDYRIIKDFTNYGITRDGKVISLLNNIILKQNHDKDGYPTVSLSRHGLKRKRRVHRLVAQAYIPNPENKPVVNHKDGNVRNNNVENLEWSTVSENTIHAYENSLISTNVFLTLTDLELNTKTEFRSIQNLADYLGVCNKFILAYIRNSEKYPFKNRYIIKFKDENRFIDNLNSVNFGRKVYIYDLINQTEHAFNSIGLAEYFTGVHTLSKLGNTTLNKIGYVVSFTNPNKVPEYKYTKEEMLKYRDEYYSKPYKKRLLKIALLDYLDNKKIYYLDGRKNFTDFIFNKHGITITPAYINSLKFIRNNKTKLYLGYIVAFYNDKEDIVDWGEYSLEEIYNSRKGYKTYNPVFKISINGGKEKIVYGVYNTIKELDPYLKDTSLFNKPINRISLEDMYNNLSNSSNISIIRLKDIKIKI